MVEKSEGASRAGCPVAYSRLIPGVLDVGSFIVLAAVSSKVFSNRHCESVLEQKGREPILQDRFPSALVFGVAAALFAVAAQFCSPTDQARMILPIPLLTHFVAWRVSTISGA
jgi:hypothetical protein